MYCSDSHRAMYKSEVLQVVYKQIAAKQGKVWLKDIVFMNSLSIYNVGFRFMQATFLVSPWSLRVFVNYLEF